MVPFANLGAWADCFDAAALPVLRSSAVQLEELRVNEEATDAHMLNGAFERDPLMVLKVLAHVAMKRKGRSGTDAETLTEALVMLGITPFYRDFGPQACVEDRLAEWPAALEGFNAVLSRAHRAARFATAIAVQRMDHDVAVIHEAALLHDFAELLMWLRAPGLMLEIARRQQLDGRLRSSAAQVDVLNVSLADLQHALMIRWHLPSLLTDIMDHKREGASVQARNVLVAMRLARHTAVSWDNPAVADDINDVATLLHMSLDPTRALLLELDSQ